eukprot:5620161-Alexandrium_andersonii.AAC.1
MEDRIWITTGAGIGQRSEALVRTTHQSALMLFAGCHSAGLDGWCITVAAQPPASSVKGDQACPRRACQGGGGGTAARRHLRPHRRI